MKKIARFNIGDVVIHKHSRYRAVVIDIDPLFQASGRYNPQALSHEFAVRNPWYRLLVDGSNQMTYVEECQLIADPSSKPVQNAQINQYLISQEGHYQSRQSFH